MKQLPSEAEARIARLPAELQGLARELYPDEQRDAAVRAREAEAAAVARTQRAEELRRQVDRGLDAAFGFEVKEQLLSKMRQCDHRPSFEQLEAMCRIISDGRKKAAALKPARRAAR